MNEQINKEIELFLSKKIKTKDVINLFYKIGEILTINKANYYQLLVLDSYLRKKYGLVISLSKKNLIKIQKFYKISREISINKLNKRELEYYIKTGKKLHITMRYNDPATDEFLKLQENLIKM